MTRRLAAAAGIVAFLLVAVASPASAAPRDPQGCEKMSTSAPLGDYCETNP